MRLWKPIDKPMVTLSLKKLKMGEIKKKKRKGDFRHFKFLFLSQCHLLVIFHPQRGLFGTSERDIVP